MSIKPSLLICCWSVIVGISTLVAADPPSPAATPAPGVADVNPLPSPKAPKKSDATRPPSGEKRVPLYSLDYEESTNSFLVPGTKNPFNGPVISTYDNGVTELVGEITNGQRSGWWVEYAENGQKTSSGLRKNDAEDGPWIYWWDSGQVEAVGEYKNGSSVGKWETFFEDGKPDSSGFYKDGLMNGPWIYHDEQTGDPRTIQFDRGVQLNK